MRPCRGRSAAILVVALSAAAPRAVAAPPAAEAPAAGAAIAALIDQLGDADFAVRETAAARLADLGAEASDALLAAAESHADLEVALRARWLVESLPLAAADDPPEVAALLDRLTHSDFDGRVLIMHRLLRLEDDAGIEPLARIVRLERSDTGSRIAAALLVREWQPDDPYWPGIRDRITAGLGPSGRTTARLLRGVVDASRAATPAAAAEAVVATAAAVAELSRPDDRAEAEGPAIDEPGEASLGRAKTLHIFRRTLIQLLVKAGRRDEAVAEAGRLFAACAAGSAEEDLVAAEAAWLADHGLPEAVDLLEKRLGDGDAFEPLVGYAAAVAWRRRGDAARATALADRAHARLTGDGVDLSRRLQAAMLLARWGADDWAFREYSSILDDPQATIGEFTLSGILCSEFLHDHGRDAEAADVLRRVLDGRTDDDVPQILMRLERDPRAVRSRMLFFASRDAAARGDTAAERRLLDESLQAYDRDVDSLIAFHRQAAGSRDRLDDARARVTRALAQIEEGIQAVPDDATGYNEYAWLAANTEGDIRKATRYSKRSLDESFDNSSYLDTLAHCRAAAGDLKGAIRTQRLAIRQEPHNRTIRLNLERFEKAAAGGAVP